MTVQKNTIIYRSTFFPLLLLVYPLYCLIIDRHIIATLCLLLLAAVLFFYIYKLFNNLSKLEHAARHLGDGDLSYQVDEKDAGVFIKVVRSINRMGEDVSRTILSLSDTCEGMKNVASDIKVISEQAKQGVLEQEHQTELAATAITQMVSTVQAVSQNAASTAKAADMAQNSAKQSDHIMGNIVHKINGMTKQLHDTKNVIENLAADTNNISSIIETISQVAEQTNLLALNAAIESARAGEHGRGFAIVADEVRNLAKRTSEATVEIQQQIAGLQKGAHKGLEVMLHNVSLADETALMVNQAHHALNDIAVQVNTITDMSHQIATASEEQYKVAEEINNNICAVAKLALNNAHRTNNTNLSSLKVYNMSQEIGSLLHRFHVDKALFNSNQALSKLFVTWGPELDIGMPEINRQHQRLVSLINELHRTLSEDYGLEAIKRIVQGLVDYTANHFSYEEELFERFGYPQSESHKEKHGQLVGQVLDFQKRVGKGEDVADELMSFLRSWLVNHIQKSDKEYTTFLLSHGAE
ncbi:bacteriohemerythrin [Shewanella putrefaciens]|uniref:Methyl-accepting chemotaxis sensory transducer n=1 Tax=Shewanella putrefaciens (strain 200) TaxID=399804 RepID=E6XKC7_SHEP2|nr:bacteriohemerythrin [Shewanella putrefaciens]MCA1897938.1 bacteriohemerythrin [Shewanella putrefaciens]UXK07957.1 bacteriohemerythrin [Shewanella putrefaciens]